MRIRIRPLLKSLYTILWTYHKCYLTGAPLLFEDPYRQRPACVRQLCNLARDAAASSPRPLSALLGSLRGSGCFLYTTFQKLPYYSFVPAPQNGSSIEGLMVSIRLYLRCLRGGLGGAGCLCCTCSSVIWYAPRHHCNCLAPAVVQGFTNSTAMSVSRSTNYSYRVMVGQRSKSSPQLRLTCSIQKSYRLYVRALRTLCTISSERIPVHPISSHDTSSDCSTGPGLAMNP